jgi:low affinity Fe/Cu permease
LIQNTQNRDSQALHAKLDELLINTREADNRLVEAEDLPDEELAKLKEHYEKLAKSVGESATGQRRVPERTDRAPRS